MNEQKKFQIGESALIKDKYPIYTILNFIPARYSEEEGIDYPEMAVLIRPKSGISNGEKITVPVASLEKYDGKNRRKTFDV